MIEIKGKIVSFELVDPPRGNENQETKDVKVLNREDIVFGYTVKIKYMDHSFYITLNFDEQKNLLEVFVNASSTSPEINSYIQALARMISNQLKHRVPLEKIIKHLDGLDSGNSVLVKFPLQQKGKFIKSIPDLLAKVLSFYGDFNKVKKLIKEHYTKENEEIPGVLHPLLGNYHIRDIEFVAAFDVDTNKVGKDLSEAIFSKPNNTRKFCDVPKLGVKVKRGPLLDGIGKYLKDVINISQDEVVDIAEELRNSDAEIVVNYLPVGSEKATRFYTEQAIKAKCAFINCTTTKIASDINWNNKFT